MSDSASKNMFEMKGEDAIRDELEGYADRELKLEQGILESAESEPAQGLECGTVGRDLIRENSI